MNEVAFGVVLCGLAGVLRTHLGQAPSLWKIIGFISFQNSPQEGAQSHARISGQKFRQDLEFQKRSCFNDIIAGFD